MSESNDTREMIVEWIADVVLLRVIVAGLLRRAMSTSEVQDFVERLQVPSHGIIPMQELSAPFERAKEDLIVEMLRKTD